MAFRKKHLDTRHEELVKENEKLRRDVSELEDAYFLHKHIQEEQDGSVHGILRKEIGGSIWRHGGEGRIKTYKSAKDLDNVSNEKPPKGGKSSKPNSAGNKIKRNGAQKTDKSFDSYHGKGNVDLIVESSQLHTVNEFSKDQINNEEISKFAQKKDVKQSIHADKVLALETQSVKPETLSALKTKVLQKVSSKVIQRPSIVKLSQNDKVPKKAAKNDKSKVESQLSKMNGQSSQNRLKPNIRVERTKKMTHGVARKDRNESIHITPAFRESESQEKFPENSFFDFHQTNIPDKKMIFDVEEEFEEKTLLLHQYADYKTADVELHDLNKEINDNITDDINTDDRDDVEMLQQTSNRTCDPRVENWLRGLAFVDVEKYIKIFADNEIDMAELELLTPVELHEIGVHAVGALNKMVRGIKKLRGDQDSDVHEAECLNQVTVSSVPKEEAYMESQYKSLNDTCPARDSHHGQTLNISDEETSLLTGSDPLGFTRQTSLEDHRNTKSRATDMCDSSWSKDSRTSLKIENGTNPSSVKSVLIKGKSQDIRPAIKGHHSVLKAKLNVRRQRSKSSTIKGKDIARPKSAPYKGKDDAGTNSKNLKREEREYKTKHISKRCRSQSLESLQRKTVEGLQAATKKLEEQQEREKEGEIQRIKMMEQRKSRRDKMAFRHQLREQEIKMKLAQRMTPSPEGPWNEEEDLHTGLESVMTVNILSHKEAGENDRSSSRERVHFSGSRSHHSSPIRSRRLQQERSRTEGSRKSLIVKSSMLEIAGDGLGVGGSLLTTQKITNKGDNLGVDMIRNSKDKKHMDSDPVASIKQQIESLKNAVNADDKETLSLIKELQERLNDLESQIKVKEETLPVKARDSVLSGLSIKAEDSKGPKGKSVSKRELFEEMRKEKDQHRKQIRHLQSELRRLQHADPVRTLELQFSDIQYSEQDLVGSGTFADVYQGLYQGSEVAIKRLKVPLPDHDRNYFAAEVSLLRDLRHPRVVLLLGVCTTDRHPLMVLEFLSQGSLFKLLHNPERPGLDHAEFHQIARDIALGMNYLHNHKPEVLHLDLKSLNILLSKDFRAKIADFGFSKLRHDADRKVTQKTKAVKPAHGSFLWMAPELLDKGDITPKADVYSFGIILWEMFTRRLPYENCSVFQVLENIRKNRRPDIPTSCTKGLRHLMERCWSPNQAVRPPFKDIISELENLAFPPAWRDLFQEAGIPKETLENLQSARTIISLVNSSLGAPEWLPVSDFPIDGLSMKDERSVEETLSSVEDSLARVSIITSSVSSQAQSEEGMSDNNSLSNESSEEEYSNNDHEDTHDEDDNNEKGEVTEDDLSGSSRKQQSSTNNSIASKSDEKMKPKWKKFDKDSFLFDENSGHEIACSVRKLHENPKTIKSIRSDTTKLSSKLSLIDEKEVKTLKDKKWTSQMSFQDSKTLHSSATTSVHSVVDKNARGEGSSRKKSEDDVQQWLTSQTTSIDSFHDLDVNRSRRTNVYVSSSTNLSSNVKPARETGESPRTEQILNNAFREVTMASTDSFNKPLTFEPFTLDPASQSGLANLTKEINSKHENSTLKNASKLSKEEQIHVNENKNLHRKISLGVKEKSDASWEDMLLSGGNLVSPTKKVMSSVRSAVEDNFGMVDRPDVTPEQITSPYIRSSGPDSAELVRERDFPSKDLASNESPRTPVNNQISFDDLRVPTSGRRSSRKMSRGKTCLKQNDCSTEIFGPPDLLENRKTPRKFTKKAFEKNDEVPLSQNLYIFREEESIYSEDVLKSSQTKDESAFQETNMRKISSGGMSMDSLTSCETKKDSKYEQIDVVRKSIADSVSSVVFEKLKLDNESSVRNSTASWMTPKEIYSPMEAIDTWMSPHLVSASPQNAVKDSDTVFPLSHDLISTSPNAGCMTRDSLESLNQDFESETVIPRLGTLTTESETITPRLGTLTTEKNKYFSTRGLNSQASLHGLSLESSESSGNHSTTNMPKLTTMATDSPNSGRQASGRKEKIRLIHKAVRNSFELWTNKDDKNNSVAANPIISLKSHSDAKHDCEFRDSLEVEDQVMEGKNRDIEKKGIRTSTTPPPPPPPPPLPLSFQDISDARKSSCTISLVNRSSVLGDRPHFVNVDKEELIEEDAPRRNPLHPRPLSGLSPFLVQSVELRTQKEQLRSISKPHPCQLQDLTQVSKETISSIAEILKMAMLDRRIAMGEVSCSVTQSVDSAWSVGHEN
ncbi:hypothetical protein CHS0354_027782 [Potamilus streckersoni]|uniref:Uncharacterized protein n=1 Tax=Potamilus streckersoni TaxID=2493646 RepID=A0AAE0VSN1_9BIVA|nr:hypothetical protein CHS0354_027782 [Potamilus streckersoni]